MNKIDEAYKLKYTQPRKFHFYQLVGGLMAAIFVLIVMIIFVGAIL